MMYSSCEMALVLAPEPVSISGFQVASQSGPIGTARPKLHHTPVQTHLVWYLFALCQRIIEVKERCLSVWLPASC
ncbi:hypothetical protein BLA99_24575, partial [Salmonella enterica]|nr:hypothetical protein [Salmonella enterica]EAT4162135.1 hypothetical protein [Salmonella enterica]EAX7428686.1 hypothetical protein [Salmonella enterica]EBQ4463394.1 hypothetical protein [Salmonella enterica]